MAKCKRLTFLLILLMASFCIGAEYQLQSPDEKISLKITVGQEIRFEARHLTDLLFEVRSISLALENDVLGQDPHVRSVETRQVDQVIKPVIREKFSSVRDYYNELIIHFEKDFSLTFRVFNNGLAYSFSTERDHEIIVQSEDAELIFAEEDSAIVGLEKDFRSSYEKPYSRLMVNEIGGDKLCFLPALIAKECGKKVLIAESDLTDYPGMWLKGGQGPVFHLAFPPYPLEEDFSGNVYARGRVGKTADYIARTRGNRTFPWRIFAVSEKDADLLTNQLVYQLAPPLKIKNPSWIKPGFVILDWWARRNIFGTDFKAGFSTETSKYFIDFCAEYGIEYFLLDDGWSARDNLLAVSPDIDMEQVAAYAREKNVGLVLWVIWSTLDRQYREALDQFYQWGVKGIKIDFMNRDDQKMVNFYHQMAEEAARRKMIVDFHGAYKPAGLRRAYPNVLTREGLIEFEYNGVTDDANPEHHTTLPFIRGVAGPMDYIPGTLNNAQKKNFRPVGDRPMGQGTRAHAIALALVLESPLQMIPDSPSDYRREEKCSRFLTSIPVEWDETRVLDARLGDYVLLARRNGAEWFVGAITDWQAREFELDFIFLGPGTYRMEAIKDGLNAGTRAIDFKIENETVDSSTIKKISLAPGGGWVARIYKSPQENSGS